MILKKNFFQRLTLEVAHNLLGCYLVRKRGNKIIRAMIVDVEAYIGEDDLACHASKGRTKRSEILYGEAGKAYVYLIYGMYHIMNIVTEKKDFPAAVMIRAVSIDGVPYKKTNGPGKICGELGINKKFHNFDITKGEKLWIEKGKKVDEKNIIIATRLGIDYAKHCALYPWRFIIKGFEGKKDLSDV